ncbi:hypothetical protein FB451DRAFT_1399567 [Mycena latifolia]|nr:hypothetical protein FB451DRAFT_1399567 [Mycena latifolia]
MARIMSKLLLAAAVLSSANAYFLFAMNDVITTERIDPIVNPGKVSGHVHTITGGSNFRVNTSTSFLRQSACTSSPIKEDKSNYWAPVRYLALTLERTLTVSTPQTDFVLSVEERILYERQRKPCHVSCLLGHSSALLTGSFSYYLFSDTPGVTTPFPDDFRMLSGTPTLRSYNASSYAQQAVTFLCLDFDGTSTKHNELPTGNCPSGIRAQINFPSCWDGKNADSADHKSHVAYLSGGPDSGTCSDPKFPVTLPRIFMEMYLDTTGLYAQRDQAMNPNQPFVYSMGDPTGYGYHADFMMGWDQGVLQKVVDQCHCNNFGDPTCCSDAGIFTFTHGGNCRITKGVNEITTGTLPALPGNNPVVPLGGTAANLAAAVTPALISPVYAYTGDSPTQTGSPVGQPVTAPAGATTTAAGGAKTTAAEGATTTAAEGATTTAAEGATSTPAEGATTTAAEGSTTAAEGVTTTKGATSTKGVNPTKGTTTTKATTGAASNPTSGSGSGSPGKGPGSGGPNAPGSGSHNNHTTCHKKKPNDKRAAVRRARSFPESHRRRFTMPDHEF